jgi:hypothetical protein
LTDKEFCDKVGIEMELFKKIKAERKENPEVDAKTRFYNKYFSYKRYNRI